MSQAAAKAPLLAALFYLALIMPLEFSVTLGGLRLSPYRVLLLIVFVSLALKLLQERRQPMNLVDGLIAAHAAWVVLALTVYGGLAQGIESGGIYVVESFGAYLLGRLTITNPREHEAIAIEAGTDDGGVAHPPDPFVDDTAGRRTRGQVAL